MNEDVGTTPIQSRLKSAQHGANGTRRMSLSERLLTRSRSIVGLVIAVLLVWLVFFITTDGIFLSDRNIINLMRQTSVTAMVALGMLVVIVQGEIDLSVGSFLALCVTVIAMVESSALMPPFMTIVVALALGAAVGLWNGVWVAKLGIPAFVATLGGLMAFRGLALALSGGRTLSGIRDEIRSIGDAFISGFSLWIFLALVLAVALAPLGRISRSDKKRQVLTTVAFAIAGVVLLTWATVSYRGLPVPVALAIVVAFALNWALNNTKWGRHAYAVGGNRSAARFAGIPIGFHVIIGFMLVGMLTAVASLIFVGRLGAAPPEAGLFLELNAIAAVVIGGASLYGGTGTVMGVLLGALLMQSLSNGLSLMNVPSAYQNIASGMVLILAVYLDVVSKRGGRPFVRL